MVVALVLLGVAALLIAGAGLVLVRRARGDAQRAREDAARLDAELAVAERRGRQVLRDLPFVALRVDRDGRLVEANPVALERFPFLVAGMTVLEAFSEHRLARHVDAALEGLSRQSFEVRLFAGGRRTYRAAVEPYEVGEVGEAREALVFLTDQSEAVAYQELRSQFVANVSHELRTPLTGLRGLLEALDDPQMDPETRRDFVSRAASETQRLEALITDILFLTELETTPGLPSSSRSDLALAAAATVADLQDVAEEQGVRLELNADGPAWTPLTDRMATTVVRNLVENAVKYAGPGATAATTVGREGDAVTLIVADDGAGIPERHLPHVFERFYRADPSRSKRLGGTGLGLSIVKHIAERFGGRAEASSREGFGTTITVTLPAEDEP
ncbi:MAG TPA: ATP-binding protein [Miltoncostaeaceae bacterium]|nr:ATP-binding protein [Miltoncostaeaceae bacterium]